MSQETVEIVQRHIAAYNRRDFEALRELSHREMEVDWSASRGLEAGVYRGLEEVLGFYQGFLDMFEQVDVEPNRIIKSGDSVVVPNTAYVRGRDGSRPWLGARSSSRFAVAWSPASASIRRCTKPSKPPGCGSRGLGLLKQGRGRRRPRSGSRRQPGSRSPGLRPTGRSGRALALKMCTAGGSGDFPAQIPALHGRRNPAGNR